MSAIEVEKTAGDDTASTSQPASKSLEPASTNTPAPTRRRWRRRLLVAALVAAGLAAGTWIGIHTIPGFGPFLSNTARSVFGNELVAWLQDTLYGSQDWMNRQTRAGDAPAVLFEVPTSKPSAAAAPSSASAGPPGPPPFTLTDPGPMHESVAAPGDGQWFPLEDPRRPDDEVRLLKMQLHPDKIRSWSVVAVVAADLSRVELHSVPGSHEPEAQTPEGRKLERPGVVPEAHRDALLAAFNGSYMSTHGHYGMKTAGVTLVRGRGLACTIAEMSDGGLIIRPWEEVKDSVDDMVWFRQAPLCMYDQGTPHPNLSLPNLGWGASSVGGTTVIRRSAIGLDQERKRLFIAIGDFVTAKAIAEALHHVGAHYVSQLDVNYSFPKLVTYRQRADDAAKLEAVPISKEFEYTQGQYVHDRSHRDFFYLTRRP